MKPQITKILLIEDNPADVRLLRSAFREIGDTPFEILRNQAGQHFDPQIVEVFLRFLEKSG